MTDITPLLKDVVRFIYNVIMLSEREIVLSPTTIEHGQKLLEELERCLKKPDPKKLSEIMRANAGMTKQRSSRNDF